MKKKYEDVIDYIEKLVSQGRIKQGERLPVIRELVKKFKCNKSTIIRAYKELEMNHKIYSIPKSGYYLVEKINEHSNNLNKIDFSEGLPDPNLLPYKEFNHSINRAVELYKNTLFTYGETQGLESLRNTLVNHFEVEQVFTNSELICITSGSQQALSILTKIEFPNSKSNILVEEPTYSLIHNLVEINGGSLVGIKRSSDGIDLNKLEEIFRNRDIKFFYTIPRLHNPLGTSYSEKEKKKIVELAEKYDVYIVEDDYLGDINCNKKNLPLSYYDINKRVIYIRSFSKSFMPGIRIGAVVLQEKIKAEFIKYKRYFDLNTSVLSQGALEVYINSGMYRNHLKKVQLQYKKKMNYLKEVLKSINTKGAKYVIPDTGFFLWISIDKNIDINALINNLKKKNVIISRDEDFFIDKESHNSIRLCVSKLSREEVNLGLRILFEEIGKLM